MSRTLRTSFLFASVLVLAACGGGVSQANFDKINNGMTVAEVEAILGKPTDGVSASGAAGDVAGSGGVANWKDGNKTISVTYLNGKVVAKVASNL